MYHIFIIRKLRPIETLSKNSSFGHANNRVTQRPDEIHVMFDQAKGIIILLVQGQNGFSNFFSKESC